MILNAALITPVTLETTAIDRESWLAELGDSVYEPAVGVLTLAAVLRAAHSFPLVFDLNGFVREIYLTNAAGDIANAAAREIATLNTEVFGFGSVCGSYPLTIRIAGELKRLRPDAAIILGGPQASVVDVATLQAFPFIDCIIRGEADEILVPILEQMTSGLRISIPGVTYRSKDGIIRNPNASPVLDLDRLPAPAFELSKSIECCSYLPIEAGRGCPFSCTFCSTNDFFRRRFRLRSPARVLEEMDRLHSIYGITQFDLVHDMFTVDRARVKAFCNAFIASGKPYTWTCSARSDFVDRELLELMAAAGCKSLFFGIETGSPRLQKVIDKSLDIDEAAAVIKCVATRGLRCTVSLIIGFPEETVEDVAATAAFGLNSARFDQVETQVSLLAALAGTPLFTKYKDQLFFDGIYSDMSHQTWEQNEDDCALIEEHADLFSNFYGLPSGAGRGYVAEFRHFLTYGLKRCRWLMIALGETYPGLTDIFDRWIEWRGENRCRARYYGKIEFPSDFCRFLEELRRESQLSDVISIFLSYYEALFQLCIDKTSTDSINLTSDLPLRVPSISLIKFPFRLSSTIEAVRNKQPLTIECYEETTVCFVSANRDEIEPRELPALGAAVLELCDGRTTLPEMIRALGPLCQNINGLSAEHLVLNGLIFFREEGLVCFKDVYAGTSL